MIVVSLYLIQNWSDNRIGTLFVGTVETVQALMFITMMILGNIKKGPMKTLYSIIDSTTGKFICTVFARTERGAIQKFRLIDQLSYNYPYVVAVDNN